MEKFKKILGKFFVVSASFVFLLLFFTTQGLFAAVEIDNSGGGSTTPAPIPTIVPAPEGTQEVTSEGEVFNNRDALKSLVPEGEGIPNCSGIQQILCLVKSEGTGEFVKGIFQPLESKDQVDEIVPEGTGGVFDNFGDFVKRLFGLFVGKTGSLNASRPEEVAFPKIGSSSLAEYRGGVDFFVKGLRPEEEIVSGVDTSGSRSSFITPVGSFSSMVEKVSQAQCVPPAILLAIARAEGESLTYSEEEVSFFSNPGWWNSASDQQKTRGHCRDTCSDSRMGCKPTDNVVGPMQFNLGTWNGLIPAIKQLLSQLFGTFSDYGPHRCNLRDSVVGAVVKIKQDSGTRTQCENWSDEAVKRVAAAYYGGCTTNQGTDYCGEVLRLYKSYSNLTQ